jgi:hypothetical protein
MLKDQSLCAKTRLCGPHGVEAAKSMPRAEGQEGRDKIKNLPGFERFKTSAAEN